MDFVCPLCKGPLQSLPNEYRCAACAHSYPVVLDIPDFRVHPDPYISIEDDRRKGERILEACRRLNFAGALAYYYSITPEVPPDRAARWTARALAQASISRLILRSSGLRSGGRLLDVGCSTAGLLAAASGDYRTVTGVDVAFRWLVVGRLQLRELGIDARLVCANAEALPFAASSFDQVTLLDVLEHTRAAEEAIAESRRVLATSGTVLCTTNNRYAPVPDPHAGVWGVGYLPRRWQARYVAWRRRGTHRYRIRVRSARELDRLFRGAGFRSFRSAAAPLFAPHLPGAAIHFFLDMYNRVRCLPLLGGPLKLVAPELSVIAHK
jgi:ubiquinone/menaquinone biosynthesis C-methylase UbiE